MESRLIRNEDRRVAALQALGLPNDDVDADLDFIMACLCQKLGFPVGFVSVIDRDTQWLKSIHGLSARQVPRSNTFCDYTIRDDVPLVVENAPQDPRFDTNPFVTGPPHLRAYAGAPIRTVDGYCIGTVCVADFEPRTISEAETATLCRFASIVERLITLEGASSPSATSLMPPDPSSPPRDKIAEHYQRLEETLAAGHWELDLAKSTFKLSPGAFDLHRLPGAQARTFRSVAARYPESERRRLADALRLARDVGRPFDMKSYFVDAVGLPRQVRVRGERVSGEGESARIAGVVHDVSGVHETEIRLTSAINADPITRVSNSQAFERNLADRIAGAPDEPFALISVGIPDIVTVRQSHGLSQMDAMLRDIATVLRTDLQEGETLGRTSYEAFSIMTTEGVSEDSIRERCRHLLTRLNVEVAVLQRRLDINPECSVAMYPRDGATVDRLLRSADLALRVSYDDPHSDVVFFDAPMRDRFEIRENATDFLQSAVDEHRILPFYQPIVRLSDGYVSGFEALVRVRLPDGSLSDPPQFWPALMDANMSRKVGFIMRDAVISQMQQWRQSYGLTPSISLNAAWSDLSNGGMHADLIKMLAARNLEPGQLKIEVTETVMLSEPATSVDANLKSLRAQGVRISLDDFGTGYGSLISLLSLPTDEVKIDRNFVGTVMERAASRAITSSIIELAAKMGITTVSEGIETPAQLAFVRERGSTHGQGYLLGPPMPDDAAAALLRKGYVDLDAHSDLSPAAKGI
ncbi:MAG: sensor domain-containing phosphodiesterase [Minwuia sp.]|nr:sensor domain-containing phosphodiesterase [Minwuia sp.]